jgi:hypothetical protein
VQLGQLRQRQRRLVDRAPGELVAWDRGSEVLEHKREPPTLSVDIGEIAPGDRDVDRRSDLLIEAHLGLVATKGGRR